MQVSYSEGIGRNDYAAVVAFLIETIVIEKVSGSVGSITPVRFTHDLEVKSKLTMKIVNITFEFIKVQKYRQ